MNKLLVFDMDGTLIKFNFGKFGSSWEAIASACGVLDSFLEMQSYYYQQKNKEKEWCEKSARLFAGQNVEQLRKRLLPLPYQGNIQTFLANTDNYLMGCATSGLDVVVKLVQEDLGFNFVVCTELEKVNGNLTGKIIKRVPLWKKHLALENKLKEYGKSMKDVIYIGDDENCIPCMNRSGVSVAFNPKTEKTINSVDYVIYDFNDLNKILKDHEN